MRATYAALKPLKETIEFIFQPIKSSNPHTVYGQPAQPLLEAVVISGVRVHQAFSQWPFSKHASKDQPGLIL
jgi:hypothetical protein